MPERQHGAPLEPVRDEDAGVEYHRAFRNPFHVDPEVDPGPPRGESAAVIVPADGLDMAMRTQQAKLFALHSLVQERWFYPDNEELSPLKAALIIKAGWYEFRRDIIRELDALNRMHPDLIGREDWSDVAKSVWRRLRKRLAVWSYSQTGQVLTPKRIIKLFEMFYSRKSPLSMATTKFVVEDTDAISAIDGTQRGWQSSALRREGTIAELAADAAPSIAKDEMMNQIDESLEDEKAGRAVEKRVR